MGKASRTKQDGSRREKIAAQREAERRAERRTRLLIAAGALVAVVAVVLTFVLIRSNSSSSTPSAGSANSGAPTGTALSSVLTTVTGVPTSVTDQAADGKGAVTAPKAASGSNPALTANGKPEVLYVGAEYCPYCAAERWSMLVSLSRFGTFSGVTAIRSAAANGQGTPEPAPNTATWTFHGSSYTSSYITFTPREVNTNKPIPGSAQYGPLETLTSAEQATFTRMNTQQAFPFVDFGNQIVIVGASYDPTILAGLTWAQIANDLATQPTGKVATAINGTANYMTAAICKLTSNQPATACTSVVQALESQI